MTSRNSLDTYRTELELMDGLLDAEETTWQLHFATEGAAFAARHRFYKARIADRERSRETSNPGEPTYGISPYDVIRISAPYMQQGIEDVDWTISMVALKSTVNIPGLTHITKKGTEDV